MEKGGSSADGSKAVNHSGQACFSLGLQSSVVGSVYMASYHCEAV